MGHLNSILVVEDDEGIREMIKLALEMEGYTVFTAVNGKQGLDLLPTIPKPSLILLDLMMPVMNGWEFVDAISKDMTLATIPVVVVTAFPNGTNAIRAKSVMKKPVDLHTLLEVVRQWCGEAMQDSAA